jgi:hypothetical protein
MWNEKVQLSFSHEHAWMSHCMYLIVKTHGYLVDACHLEFH